MVKPLAAQSLSARPWRSLRWLVVAPHPDDETLGAGALIAQTARERRFAGLVYLTDGSGSHDVKKGLVATRKREARLALARLTGQPSIVPLHLDWQDAAPAPGNGSRHAATRRSLVALCHRRRVDAIAVTAGTEPHCDHEAAFELVRTVRGLAKRPLLIAQYLVWATTVDPRQRPVRTAPMLPGIRRHALQAHRSQLTASRGAGFRLPAQRRRMPERDLLYVRTRS